MERENIYYHTDGFVKDAKYTANLLEFLARYKDQFGNAESLELILEEVSYGMLKYQEQNRVIPIQISEDGRKIVIKTTTHKYYDLKGKVTGVPSPQDIYSSIKFLLDKAVKEYQERFPQNLIE